MKDSPREYFLPLLITAFVLISGIISAYTLFQQSIRLDEAQSLWVATKTIPSLLSYLAADVHVPLYELLLHIWLQLFGTTIIAARSLSLLFFLASIPILYQLTREVGNRTMAFLTIGLYSLSPFIIWYSYEARMYSLFTLVVCISHYFFIRLLSSPKEKYVIGYFFSTLFGLYTHYFFLLLLITQCLYFIIHLARTSQQRTYDKTFSSFWSENKRKIFRFTGAIVAAVILFIPWLIYFYLQGFASNTQPIIPAPPGYNIFQTAVNFLFGLQSQTLQSILVALWPLAVIPLFFLFSRRTVHISFSYLFYFILATIFPVLLLFFASYYKPLFLPRYLILVTPSFFMLVSWSLFHISKNASRIVISLFAFIMFCFLLFQNISYDTPVKEDYEGVSNFLEQSAKTRDLIIVSSPFTIYPVMYYYQGAARIDTIPQWNMYKAGSIPPYDSDMVAKQMQSYTKSYQNIFIVFSYNQGYEQILKNYLDNHYKRLQLKKFSPGLELRKYQLQYAS